MFKDKLISVKFHSSVFFMSKIRGLSLEIKTLPVLLVLIRWRDISTYNEQAYRLLRVL